MMTNIQSAKRGGQHLVLALLLLLFSATASRAEAGAPASVVEQLHAALLSVMRDADTLGFDGRYEKLEAVVQANFDFETIARVVTGRAWKDASEAQKDAFLGVFRELSTATYASNFSGYNGETFRTLASEQGRGGMIVKTELVKADGSTVPLNYMLRENNAEWKIVNVTAQGVSDLSLKRAEYSAVINAEGLDSLVNKLRGKVDQMGR